MAVIYARLRQAFVKQITSTAVSLRHGGGNGQADGELYRQDRMMAQRLQTSLSRDWVSKGGDRRWLAALVDAMENAARPELRSRPCEPTLIAAVSAHLARPVSAPTYYGSAYSLRN